MNLSHKDMIRVTKKAIGDEAAGAKNVISIIPINQIVAGINPNLFLSITKIRKKIGMIKSPIVYLPERFCFVSKRRPVLYILVGYGRQAERRDRITLVVWNSVLWIWHRGKVPWEVLSTVTTMRAHGRAGREVVLLDQNAHPDTLAGI